MKTLARLRLPFLILLSGFFLLTSCDREKEKPDDEAPFTAPQWVTIGTDKATGLSHVTGLSIAKVAGKKLEAMGFPIRVKTTDGPVSSLNAVDAGDLDFAVVRSDVLYEATRGLGPWAAQGPQTDLLAVFTVHAESVSLLAAEDAGIETLEDLKGKRVNIGTPGSKERMSSALVLENAGLKKSRWSSEMVEVIPLKTPPKRPSLNFLLNHAEEPRTLALPEGATYKDLLTGREYSGMLSLAEYGVALLEG